MFVLPKDQAFLLRVISTHISQAAILTIFKLNQGKVLIKFGLRQY